MNNKSILDADDLIVTNIPISCTETQRNRYRKLARKLQDMKKKRVLINMSREAILGVVEQLEQALEELEAGV